MAKWRGVFPAVRTHFKPDRWFMPALHLDVSIKLVQYINLAQAMG